METRFNRVRSLSDIIIVLTLIIGGSALVAFPTPVSVNIFGMTLSVTGIILLFALKTAYKDSETGELLKKTEKYFPASKMDSISKLLASNPGGIDLKDENVGNGLRLDVFYNKTSGHAFVQLLEYIPYKYEPCSNILECNVSNIENLLK